MTSRLLIAVVGAPHGVRGEVRLKTFTDDPLALHIDRARLPPPEEDEFYLADLIGLEAVTEEGESLGRIVAVPNFGGGELLEIVPEGRRTGEYLPFTKAFVPQVDIAGGRVVVRVPEGLFDDPSP